MSKEVFLIDSNSLITPYLTYYSFDFAPTFWAQMETSIETGRIAVLNMVKNEIIKNSCKDDALAKWLRSLTIANMINSTEASIILKYGEIIQHVEDNACYKNSAVREWSKETVADAWLIAAVAVYGYTIITFETNNTGLNSKNPSKEAKIPDVAQAFGVPTKNLYYLMKSLNFKL